MVVVPEIKEIENTDANALVCKIQRKLSDAFCKRVYRDKIGMPVSGLSDSLMLFDGLIWLLTQNPTDDEYDIYHCYYKNRY